MELKKEKPEVKIPKDVNDPGFGTRATRQRSINKDGTFNILRKGLPGWRFDNTYNTLITMSWLKFSSIIVIAYLIVNLVFATIYALIGTEHLRGIDSQTVSGQFADAFFFSAQTISTVGYGHISPHGFLTSTVAAIESMFGLLAFALATGLLYGRFSKPQARILYSAQALIAPYHGIQALMFRIANVRNNQLIEVEAQVSLGINQEEGGKIMRRFYDLDLERRKITLFPLSWTIVHPLTEKSPLFGLKPKDFEKWEAEIFITLKAFDDTYSQTVHSRNSYMYDEIVWNARFVNIIGQTPEGVTRIELDRINEHEVLN